MWLNALEVHPDADALAKRTLKLDQDISLPTMRNSSKLEAGDELFVWWEAPVKKKEGAISQLTDAPAPKRARAS